MLLGGVQNLWLRTWGGEIKSQGRSKTSAHLKSPTKFYFPRPLKSLMEIKYPPPHSHWYKGTHRTLFYGFMRNNLKVGNIGGGDWDTSLLTPIFYFQILIFP